MAPSLPISWALYVLFTDWLFGCTTWWLCSPTSASDNLFLYFLYTPPGALHSPTVCYSTGCPPSAFKGAWDPHEYHCGWNYPSTTEIFMAAFRTLVGGLYIAMRWATNLMKPSTVASEDTPATEVMVPAC